jgi:beta-glucanase (GH16 family)
VRYHAVPLLALAALAVAHGVSAQTSAAPAHAERLVWSEDFSTSASTAAPNPDNWTYDTGPQKNGNRELEIYCGYASNESPCNSAEPNSWVGSDGYLHLVARQPSPGIYTSARLKTEGLQSFQYGRMEARIRIPKGQGMWPAFWMLGDNISQVGWPKCGEFDIMENIGKTPAAVYGSIHGPGFIGSIITDPYSLPSHADFGDAFHVYGMMWSPGKVEYYVDSPSNIYASFTRASLPAGATWPFDEGKYFFILNLAVGGVWPGNPDASTRFPAEMLVDYVRVYQDAPGKP